MEGTKEILQPERTYFNDTENPGEMARLMIQARYVTKGLGGPIPTTLPLDTVCNVLDIGTGPGEWAHEMAQLFPHMRVTGIDLSHKMVEVAQMLATQSKITNASFRQMDATQPLDFADGTFDLIHGRLLFGFMARTKWPEFIQECHRLLRPGGILLLVESEMLITSSPALEQLSSCFTRALYNAGQGFSTVGGCIGVTPLLTRFLTEGDFEIIQERGHAINYSAGTKIYQDCYENARISFLLMQPYLIKWGTITREQVEELYQQMLIEMLQPNFCALNYFYQVAGFKPLDG